MIYHYNYALDPWGPCYAEVDIEYEYFKGDPSLMWHWDPDGLPEVNITSIFVIYLGGEGYNLLRDEMGDWVKDLDRLALKEVDDLYDELVDAAEIQ